jgi:hypothetical protein
MPYENVKIIDPYVEKGWTPELKLTLATAEEVDFLEATLNLTFPEGYKEYVTTFGKGSYYGIEAIRVDMPSAILSKYREYQQRLDEYWFWEDGEELLPKERAVECIRIADTDGGNEIIFHPSNSKELFLLPHDEEVIYKIGTNLYEAIDWLCNDWSFDTKKERSINVQRYFVPDNQFAYTNGVISPWEI